MSDHEAASIPYSWSNGGSPTSGCWTRLNVHPAPPPAEAVVDGTSNPATATNSMPSRNRTERIEWRNSVLLRAARDCPPTLLRFPAPRCQSDPFGIESGLAQVAADGVRLT